MKYLCLIIVLFFSCTPKDKDEFDPIPGKGYGIDIHDGGINYAIICSDGNFAVCGSSASQANMMVAKFAPTRSLLWEKEFPKSEMNSISSIAEAADGGFILTGNVLTAGKYYVAARRLDSKGNSLWLRYYGVESQVIENKVIRTGDNDFVIASAAGGLSEKDLYIMKLNGDGDTLWTKTFYMIDNQLPYAIMETANRGLLLTGTYIGSGHVDLYLLKLNENGEKQWDSRTMGNSGDFLYPAKTIELSNGDLLACGRSANPQHGLSQAFLVRTGSTGQHIWLKEFGEEDRNESFFDIVSNGNDGFTASGSSQDFNMETASLPVLMSVSAEGSELWQRIYTDEVSETGSFLFRTHAGDYYQFGNHNTLLRYSIRYVSGNGAM